MTKSLTEPDVIEHLDWTPLCESRWHEQLDTVPGKATHYAESRCCRRALLCQECVQGVRAAATLGVVYRCVLCGMTYPAATIRLVPL